MLRISMNTLAYCDEITLYPESFFRMLSTRMSEENASMFCTTNPDSPYHYIKTDYIDKAVEDVCRVFSFTIDDNPNLPSDYVIQLKKEFSGLWYDRFILGKWVLAEGTVYDMWNEARFCISTSTLLKKAGKPQFRNYVVGVDYGTSNPTSFLMVGFDSYDGPKYVVKEYYHDGRKNGQKTDAQYRVDLLDFIQGYNVTAIVLDPSAASFKTELRSHGVITRDANNSKIDGIRYVSSLLNQDKLFIDYSCFNLKKEFTAYVWDQNAQKRGLDEPIKEFDHALDALRYALYTIFGTGQGGIIAGMKKK